MTDRGPRLGRLGLVWTLAVKSLASRRLTALLTVLSVAVSVALIVAVNGIRTETKASFARTISGADLIVGARGGPLNLLLYAVFRIGDATSGMRWESFEDLTARPEVAWAIPLSLGDAHRGFRVLGTTADYFTHYRYGRMQALEFASGQPFADAEGAVLGAEVAATLGYRLGDSIIVSHGVGEVGFTHHDDAPFRVVGVLARTGTPVDATVHIALGGVERMHGRPPSGEDIEHGHADEDAEHGHADEGDGHGHDDEDAAPASAGVDAHDAPEAITACIVGLKSPQLAFRVQRLVNDYRAEPLLAIVPGVVLRQLWALVGVVETALLATSLLVILAGLVGMLTMLLTGLGQRRREMAVLRAVGAGRGLVFGLVVAEAVLLAAAAAVAGVLLAHAGLFVARDVVSAQFGLVLAAGWPGGFELAVVVGVALAAGLAATLPAWRVLRMSLADGLTVRLAS